MGKNNRRDLNKKSNSPIFDEDLNKKFLGTNSNDRPQKKFNNNGGNRNFQKKERPVVEPDEVMKTIVDLITNQVKQFIDEQRAGLDNMATNERIAHESSLYKFDYPAVINDKDGNAINFYMIDRSVRTDRQDHSLTRSSCTLVGIQDGVPKYSVSTYLTKNLMGNITIIKMTDNGPDFRNSYRVDIINESGVV